MKRRLISSSMAVALLFTGAGHSSASTVTTAAQTNLSSLQGMDLENALLAVRSQRAGLLEDQLKNQLEQVQVRNAEISKLNERLATCKNEEERALIKQQMDTLANSQQMDTLRLQSLSNKRNEAFDTMTNFIKKMQDNRSSILTNMR